MIDDSPSFFGQRVRLHTASHKVHGLRSTNQRTVERICYQFRLSFTEGLVRVDRGLDKSTQVWRKVFDILSFTLDVTVNGGAALEVRLDGVVLILNEKT